MPPKKRQKRSPPEIENYEKLSFLAREMAKFKKQKFQYNMLLKQIYELISKQRDSAEFSEETSQTLRKDVRAWFSDIEQAKKQSSGIRDKALKTLKTLDMTDDDALKGAALMLAEEETRLAAIEGLESRWYRIVRYKNSPIGIEKHTQEWFTRFYRQFQKTSASIEDLSNKIREIIDQLTL